MKKTALFFSIVGVMFLNSVNGQSNPKHFFMVGSYLLKAKKTDNYPNILVYPNPIEGNSINIQVLGFQNFPANYQIFDISGRMITEGTISKNKQKLFVDSWNSQSKVYILKVNLNDYVFIKKIIKNNKK
jgi:hypothetical protein